MSLQEDYLALSKGARMHLKYRSDNQFYFRTSGQIKWFIWGAIGCICLLSSLLMSVVLEGTERVIYMVTSALLISASTMALGMRRHLVLDASSGTLLRKKSWWGIVQSVQSESPLADQRAVVAPIAELSKGCLLEIAGQKYTIGTFDETSQLAIFINHHFQVPAFERVTQWPNEVELGGIQSKDSATEAESALRQQAFTPVDTTKRTGKSLAKTQARYVPIGEQKVFLKLALPFPLFLVLGIILSQIANKGGL